MFPWVRKLMNSWWYARDDVFTGASMPGRCTHALILSCQEVASQLLPNPGLSKAAGWVCPQAPKSLQACPELLYLEPPDTLLSRSGILMLLPCLDLVPGPGTVPRCSSVPPLRVPAWILFLLCLR